MPSSLIAARAAPPTPLQLPLLAYLHAALHMSHFF